MAFEKYAKYLDNMAGQGKNIIPGFKTVIPDINNFYTGLEMKPALTGALMIGTLAWGVGSQIVPSVMDPNGSRAAAMKNTQDTGYLPGMSGDAVGNASSGNRNLGATGDIVFGMYNARKG